MKFLYPIFALWFAIAFTSCTSQPPVPTSTQISTTTSTSTATQTNTSTLSQPINKVGLALTKYYEGLYLKAYQDGVKVWTICYGRIDYPDGSKVKAGDTATKEQCEAYLLLDLEEEGSAYVRKLVPAKYELNDNQWSALVSFTFNRGPSRLRLLLNESHNKQELADNLLHYDYAGTADNHMLGLKRRRRSERALFLSQNWEQFKEWK